MAGRKLVMPQMVCGAMGGLEGPSVAVVHSQWVHKLGRRSTKWYSFLTCNQKRYDE